jgi:hypothetical protein
MVHKADPTKCLLLNEIGVVGIKVAIHHHPYLKAWLSLECKAPFGWCVHLN